MEHRNTVLTSVLVSCIECSMTGMTRPSSLATHSSAPGLTRFSIALSAATLVLQPLVSSRTRHRTSNTSLLPSTAVALINAVIALFTALLTGWPLSCARLRIAGMRGKKTPSTPVPKLRDMRSTRTAADSFS